MNEPKVTIGVILYMDTKYLSHSIPSLLAQDYTNTEFIFRDQSPNGEVYEYLKKSHPAFFEKATIEKTENLMHSGGHNAMIRQMKGEIYICASNDMLYPKNFVSKIVEEMKESGAKVATCKLMQWNFKQELAGNPSAAKTSIIDSYGIGLTKSHSFFDLGQNVHENEFSISAKRLGPSGALAVYHKDALSDISYKNEDGNDEYFDETLHYKNDCDLAYRLSWSGYTCLLVDVKVHHDRQLGHKSKNVTVKFRDHHKKTHWEKESSLFGHLLTLEKNYSSDFSTTVRVKTWLSRMNRFIHTTLLNPSLLPTYSKIIVLKNDIMLKRNAIHKKRSASEIEELMR